jgi:hypothetical protein
MFGFWVPIWYLVAIVLSVLWCTASDYSFGILLPLCCLSRDTQNPYIKGQTTQWLQDTKLVLRIRTSKDRQHNGHKIPNGYSESVHQRTDNTMALRVPIWYLMVIVLSVLWCTDSEYLFGILWPLCCVSFDVRILSTHQIGTQNLYIKGQTTQWPQDTKLVLRIRTSKDRQHNGNNIPNGYSESVQQILSTNLVSCGHCVVCPLIYGFLVPLWYLVAIVLSVLWCTDSEYPFGILWPLCCLSFDVRILSTPLVSCSHKDRQRNGYKIPNWYSESVHQRTDNTMATRYQRSNQKPVCPLMYGFWVPIWYLVAIALSVLWCMDSEYLFGILWP